LECVTGKETEILYTFCCNVLPEFEEDETFTAKIGFSD
jgi:hypothetical protein